MKVKTKKRHGRLVKEVVFNCIEQDPDSPERDTKIKIKEECGSIFISPKGYGDASSKNGGDVIMIERYEGKLRIVIWSDITQEDFTQVIDLEGAREDARLSI